MSCINGTFGCNGDNLITCGQCKKDEQMEIHICTKCKKSKQHDIFENIYYCRIHTTTDYVTGEETMQECSKYRFGPKCPDYEEA